MVGFWIYFEGQGHRIYDKLEWDVRWIVKADFSFWHEQLKAAVN